jgi:hypothetical protein
VRVVTVRLLVLPLLLLGLLGGGVAGAATIATAEQLALMPLPKSHLPSSAGSLPLDQQSGVVTNNDAAGQATGNVTAAALTRLGRLTGYELDYTDNSFSALTKGKGLLGIETGVDLYRNARAAKKGMAFWHEDETDFAGLKGSGVKVSVKQVPAPSVGQQRFSFAGSLTVSGKPPIYGVDVVFRVGALVAVVTVTAADPHSGRPLAASLARKLEQRIGAVLSGKLKGPPTKLPGRAKAGPPSNGMDLGAMTIRPADLGGGKVEHEGYELDKDLTPISAYVREISGTPFATFREQVELFHSATEAEFTVSLLASALSLNQPNAKGKPKPDEIAYAKTTRVAVDAGDEARALIAKVRFGDGTAINEGIVLVRVGSVVAIVSVGMPGNVAIPAKVLAQLSQLAANRIATGLGKSGVA